MSTSNGVRQRGRGGWCLTHKRIRKKRGKEKVKKERERDGYRYTVRSIKNGHSGEREWG